MITMLAPATPKVGVKLVMVGRTGGGGGTRKVKPVFVVVPVVVVTLTAPVAPAPRTAVMFVVEFTTNDFAGVSPNFTAVTPMKPVPVITMLVPLVALVGVKLVIVGSTGGGGGTTTTGVMTGVTKVKPARDATPFADSTKTEPVAPVPTTAVICVGESTVNFAAATDAVLVAPKRTEVMPVKFVPRITTLVPVVALVGVKLVMVG
jgi:hypothetical protein